MRKNQFTQGLERRVMYLENKDGTIEGIAARIGWVTFSKTGQTVYYRGKTLRKAKRGGILGNFYDEETGEEYWISGVKKRGSNEHWALYRFGPTTTECKSIVLSSVKRLLPFPRKWLTNNLE